MIPSRHSFELLSKAEVKKFRLASRLKKKNLAALELKKDSQKKAETLVFSSTPASNVVGAEIRKIHFASIRLKKKNVSTRLKKKNLTVLELKKNSPKLKDSETDGRKRTFLKLAGLAGLAVAASQLLPKKAEALVFGSTPASNVVGVKDSDNLRISPAKEGGNLATIAGKDFATQITLAAIKAQTDKLTFTGSDLQTVGGSAASVVGLEDAVDTRINPATDDSLLYLRRMVKLMESQAAVDGQNRQRVAVESAVISSGTITTVTTVTTCSTVTSVTNVVTMAGWNQQMFCDVAHNTYANALRSRLTFA